MQCPHCQQEHPDEASFCPVTGKSIESSRNCPNCGQKVEATWMICAYCGKPTGIQIPTPTQNVQTSLRSMLPASLPTPAILGGLGILALLVLCLVVSMISSMFGDKKPPYYGAFIQQGRSLVELPEDEFFGIPRASSFDQLQNTNDTMPVVLLWRPDTRLEYLTFYSITGRKEVRYNATSKDDDIVELRPAQALDPGIYCYIQGNPLAAFLPGWCFEVQ
jgi:hypothetical protein